MASSFWTRGLHPCKPSRAPFSWHPLPGRECNYMPHCCCPYQLAAAPPRPATPQIRPHVQRPSRKQHGSDMLQEVGLPHIGFQEQGLERSQQHRQDGAPQEPGLCSAHPGGSGGALADLPQQRLRQVRQPAAAPSYRSTPIMYKAAAKRRSPGSQHQLPSCSPLYSHAGLHPPHSQVKVDSAAFTCSPLGHLRALLQAPHTVLCVHSIRWAL
jgi:hypothetical protein